MRLIYDNDGVAAVLTPAPKFLTELTGTDEEKLIHIANKDLPTGTKYEIIADSVDLSDRSLKCLDIYCWFWWKDFSRFECRWLS